MRILVVKKGTIIKVAVAVLLIVAAIIVIKLTLTDSKPVSSQSESMPICRVNTDEKKVALTFDTAFGDSDYTSQILEVLSDEGVRATFCVMGLWANEYPEALDAILRGGHEIASHSMNHVRYPELTSAEIIDDAESAANLIFDKTGYDTRLLRLPYGAFDTNTILSLESEGFVPVKWSLDSKDWKGYDAEKIVTGVMGEVKEGDIIMFQNNMEQTPAAVRDLVLSLREKGYKIVPLGDLLLSGDYIINADGTQMYFQD